MQTKFHKHRLENLIVVPKIVTIHYLEFDRFYDSGGESHDFWEMVYADKEDFIVTAGTDSFPLRQGEAVFHQPGEFHALRADRVSAPNVFIITFECRSAAMRFFEGRRLKLPAALRTHILSIMREAKQTFVMDRQDPHITGMQLQTQAALGGQQMIRLHLEMLLVSLLRSESEKPHTGVLFLHADAFDDALVREIIGILQENLYGSMRIEALCRRLNFGKSRLYTVFKEKTGCGIMDYYRNLKIAEAKNLLRQRRLSLTELADTLGFHSLSYFCTLFKSKTGMTPSQYLISVAK